MLIDAHLHICPAVVRRSGVASLGYGRIQDEDGSIVRLMPASFDRSNAPVEVALATMDEAEIERALLIAGPTYGVHDDYVAMAVRRWPERFAALTAYKPFLGKRAVDDVQHWMADVGFVGIKVEVPETRRIWRHEVNLLGDLEMRVWDCCAQLGGLLMLHLDPGPVDCSAVLEIADTFSSLRIVIAHLGQPPLVGWQEQVRLARHPRIFLDVSALPWFFRDEEYPFPSAQRAIEWAVREVGAAKLMWGTDFPSTLRYATYRQLVDLVRGHCDSLTPGERDLILGGVAEQLLRPA